MVWVYAVFREEVFGAGGEVEAAAAGNQDFAAWFRGVVDEEHAQASVGEQAGAEQACRASAEDGGVVEYWF